MGGNKRKPTPGIREDRIITPKPNVAGPAFEAMRSTGSEPSLRELYENLLTTAMDLGTAEQAHPAFVEIIKQLTPDEAKIVNSLPTRSERPLISLYGEEVKGRRAVGDDGPDKLPAKLLVRTPGPRAPAPVAVSLLRAITRSRLMVRNTVVLVASCGAYLRVRARTRRLLINQKINSRP